MGEHRLITAAKQAAQMAKTPAHDPALVEKTAEAICDGEFWPGHWLTLDKDSNECALYRRQARFALDAARPAIRREVLEEAAKAADEATAFDDALQKSAGCWTTGQRIAASIRALKGET